MRRCVLLLFLGSMGCQADRFQADSPRRADRFAEFVSSAVPDAGIVDTRSLRNRTTLEHHHLDLVLRRFVSVDGVDYAALWADPEARELLRDYRDIIAGVRPEAMVDPNERLAFWLNAYTALVLEGISELVARDGVDAQVSADEFAIYTRDFYRVAGFDLRLEEIEHLVLRGDPTYSDVRDTPSALGQQLIDQHRLLFPDGRMDARVNFAVSFGARGFPVMPERAYQARTLQAVLAQRTSAFVNDPVRGASERGISILFDWFRRDFVRDSGSIRRFLDTWYEGDVRRVDTERFLQYSWGVQ